MRFNVFGNSGIYQVTGLTIDDLVSQLRDAAAQNEPSAAVSVLMKRTFSSPERIAGMVPDYADDDVILHEDDSVSIWHCRFRPGVVVPPHDHQTHAMIGVYQGAELNRFYVREREKLVHKSTRRLAAGEVLSIGPNGIHTVQAQGAHPSCAIHVYLAALTSIERSLFDWDTGAPYAFTDERYQRMLRTAPHGAEL